MKLPKDTEVFQCVICGAMFLSKDKLEEHEIECNKIASRCPHCEGKGYTLDMNSYDIHRIQCPACLGSGKKLL